MADNESTLVAEIDENFLRCGICFERYKSAKMLPCLHSFCEPCLIQMAEGGSAITCPVCRRQHDLTSNGVDGISTSAFLNDLVQLFTERECKAESNKCDGCDRGEATNHCVECTFDLCKACVVPHTKFPLTKSHRLVSIAEYNASVHGNPASVLPPVHCNKHPCYEIEFYCDACDVVTCAKCTILNHSQQEHRYRCVNEAAQSFRADLAAIVDKSKEKKAEAQSSKVKVQEMLESIDKCYVRQEEHIRDTIRQSIEETTGLIRKNGDKVLTELKDEYDKRKVNLTAQLKELDIAENDLTSTREYVEKLMHYGNASQLMSAKKGVDHQTKELLKVQTQVEPVEDDYMEFDPCDDFCSNKSLGTMKFLPTMYKLDKVTQFARVGNEILATIRNMNKPPLQGEMPYRVKVEAMMQTPDGNTQKVEIKNNENGIITLSARVEVQGEYELSVTVRKKPVQGSPVRIKVIPTEGLVYKLGEKGLRTIDNLRGLWGITIIKTAYLIVCDADIQGLQFLSLDEGGRKNIQFRNVSGFYPNDVAVSMDGNLLITDYGNQQVIVCDENGELIGCFGKGKIQHPIGIAISPVNGRVYVVDSWAHCIHIYDHEGNDIKSFGSEGSQVGQFSSPLFVCIDNIGNVYVSDSDNHRIQVFNGDGQFLYTFGSHGSRDAQLHRPYGVAVDRRGNVYVSDNGSNRIVKYDSHGKFVRRVDDASSQLDSPIGVCVTDDDRVIVSDRGNGCIRVCAQ